MNDLLTHIAACVGGAFEGTDTTVVRVTTDSRRANLPEGTLFVAIRGTNRDGHDYIEPLYRKGVRAFIVDAAVAPGATRKPDSSAATIR
ncbi:Mur ligase domain-containing protein [Alistipes sp. AF48-12]|uniref:Mur ligase domain-containing protein n=1 Tax=Alistipes sp. AF48-12 TaxID=2291998 RepID=UPI002870A76C|nr:Mur ligase domain-containing protein [Alistipes sp. AF48-12]